MHAIGPFTKWRIHHSNNRLRDGRRVSIGWLQCGEPFERDRGRICSRPLRIAGRLDLVLDVAGAPPKLNSEILFNDVFVCVVASRHPFKKSRFTMDEYLRYRHVVVDVLSGQQTPVDRPLAVLGVKRSVGLVLPYFLPGVLAVAQSDMILTTPSRLACELEKTAGVRVIKAPREIAGFRYEMTWHARLTADPAHAWFRDQVRSVARELQ